MGRLRQGSERDVHTLVVLHDVSEVVPAAVMSFADAHGIVGEVDITVVACLRSV
jgi:hypothetical protein